MSANILIVDDDPHIRNVLKIALKRDGHTIRSASDGVEALDHAKDPIIDLIILDIGLPEMDGFEVCKKIRSFSDVPILFLTARDDEFDTVLGLELGADDYVSKPFSPRELCARIKVILKRAQRHSGNLESKSPETYHHGDLEISPNAHQCRFIGQAITLTASEMKILKRLMQKPDIIVTRAQLTHELYGANIHVSERTIDSHLRNLRSKLTQAGCANSVETLHGVGFRMGSCKTE